MLRILILVIVFFTQESFAASSLVVSSWQEKIMLNKTGKTGEVLLKGKINLRRDEVMMSFMIAFDDRQKIKINKVIVDGKVVNYVFANNALKIKFLQPKENNSAVAIYFSYEEKDNDINEFLRQEEIYVPEFAANANAKVIISFPDNLESATLNPNIVKNDNSFIYSNIVPRDGVHEIIKLTPAQSAWKVSIKTDISANKPLGRFNIKIPEYFQIPSQRVSNYEIVPSIAPLSSKAVENGKILTFSSIKNNISIENKAVVYTGGDTAFNIARNPKDYLKYSQEEFLMLAPILEKIKRDSKNQNLPLYARIGAFVNDFISYDKSYIGKLPTIKEILQHPVGVCSEYANLYNALARIAGIPAVILNGGACGDGECSGHSWNLIYYNNKWIEVDPTWNLMSGVVSSSHVYIADSGNEQVRIEYLDDKKELFSKTNLEMTNILQ